MGKPFLTRAPQEHGNERVTYVMDVRDDFAETIKKLAAVTISISQAGDLCIEVARHEDDPLVTFTVL